MRGWRMPQQVEAIVHIDWVLNLHQYWQGMDTIESAQSQKALFAGGAWPVVAPPPSWAPPLPRASRLTWPARRSRDPSRRRHLGATAEEGQSGGKREGKESGTRRARTRARARRGPGRPKEARRSSSPPPDRRYRAPGRPSAWAPRAMCGLAGDARFLLAGDARGAATHRSPRACVHCGPSGGPAESRGPPCASAGGGRPAAPQVPLWRLLLLETWNRLGQPGWSLSFFNPRPFDHCVV